MFLTSNAGEGFSHGLQVIWTKAGGQPKTLYNSPDVQVGRYCHSAVRMIIRPRCLCRDSAANGPQLQGVSAEDSSKAESLGADALQLGPFQASIG
jgi:hypothetical protein